MIPDHLEKNLSILFIGFNPSLKSGELGHHYANPHNRFWKILYESSITDRIFRPEEDHLLLQLGFGFTNIVARPTRTAAEITKKEYQAGSLILVEKLESYRPKVACFVGKGVYEQYSRKRNVLWGAQDDPYIQGIIEYVVPSSSGLVRMKVSDMIEIYRGLKAFY